MTSEISLWATIGSAFGTGISFLVNVALLIVALTVVRRRRPDAALLITCAAGVNLALTLLMPIATTAAAAFMSGSSSGGNEMFKLHTAIGAAGSLVRGVSAVLLILGIVRLASPPNAGDPTQFQGSEPGPRGGFRSTGKPAGW